MMRALTYQNQMVNMLCVASNIFSFLSQGLIPAVKHVFPESEHRFCVRHLHSNFQEKFKGEVLKNQLWTCARSSSEDSWKRNMEKDEDLGCWCL
jgi:hypothetical protein